MSPPTHQLTLIAIALTASTAAAFAETETKETPPVKPLQGKLEATGQRRPLQAEIQSADAAPTRLFGGINEYRFNGGTITLMPLTPQFDPSTSASLLELTQRQLPQQPRIPFMPAAPNYNSVPSLQQAFLPPHLQAPWYSPAFLEQQSRIYSFPSSQSWMHTPTANYQDPAKQAWNDGQARIAAASRDYNQQLANIRRQDREIASLFYRLQSRTSLSMQQAPPTLLNFQFMTEAGNTMDGALADLHHRTQEFQQTAIVQALPTQTLTTTNDRLLAMQEHGRQRAKELMEQLQAAEPERLAEVQKLDSELHGSDSTNSMMPPPPLLGITPGPQQATDTSAHLAPPKIAHDTESLADAAICWDPWYARLAQTLKQPLIEQLNQHGHPLGSDTVRITAFRDLRIRVEVVDPSNPAFDDAIIEAYRQLNFNPALAFPEGSQRKSVTFLTDHRHLANGDLVDLETHQLTGDTEHKAVTPQNSP